MKIAIISFGYSDTVIPSYMHLKNNYNNIHLYLCYAHNRKYDSILDFRGVPIYTGFVSDEKVKELIHPDIINYLGSIDRIKFFIFYNLKLRSLRNLFLALRLSCELKKYDIIHINGLNGVLPILVLLLRKKKLVFTIHDIRPHSGDITRFGIAKKTIDYLCRSKYSVIALNKHDYEYCRMHYAIRKSKFVYIPFGVLDVFRYVEPFEMPTSDILFFGRIAGYKGLKYLTCAAEILRKEGKKISVVIAGSGHIEPELMNKIYENEILLINKHLSNEELAGLIRNTKYVVCPYTDTTQSGVVMTSFALGKPVIASATGSFKEIIIDGYNGFLFEPKNTNDLAEKIKQALTGNTPEKMEKRVKEFSESSEEYSWERISKKYIEFYNNYYECKR
jgi:glycosyltransferase involved in cell wall biosynthesis